MSAIAVFTGYKVKGFVLFLKYKHGTIIMVKLCNLEKGKHGFHIHEKGNLFKKDCSKCEGHYNPFNKQHGDRKDNIRHVGDLGNIEPDENGYVKKVFFDPLVQLDGRYSVIGRSVVIHEQEDDLGKGGNEESLKTGNAGKRIACAVIGYM